ncbi:hypothetical protein IMCC9480_798 [Oxalobacteraceae bacterium IMCC9480]|nr:hypothetical protein IMCC9480_798 [Oxalobacteraceae bacterium IMCC9480]NDP60207.1 hypothetical protein [Oxalobacteraceae bacterium]
MVSPSDITLKPYPQPHSSPALPHWIATQANTPATLAEHLADMWKNLSNPMPAAFYPPETVPANTSKIACPNNATTVKLADGTPIHAAKIALDYTVPGATASKRTTHIAGQSPPVDSFKNFLVQGIESGRGLYQFVSTKAHQKGSDSKETPIIQMLQDAMAAAESSGGKVELGNGRYQVQTLVLQAGADRTGDHVRYDLTVFDTVKKKNITVPLTQAGLKFTNAVLSADHIARASKLMDEHNATLEKTGQPSPDDPLIASHAGHGRNGTLITYRAICQRIKDGLVNDDVSLEAALKEVISKGRQAKPHFVHSLAQFEQLHAALQTQLKANRPRASAAGASTSRAVEQALRAALPSTHAGLEMKVSSEPLSTFTKGSIIANAEELAAIRVPSTVPPEDPAVPAGSRSATLRPPEILQTIPFAPDHRGNLKTTAQAFINALDGAEQAKSSQVVIDPKLINDLPGDWFITPGPVKQHAAALAMATIDKYRTRFEHLKSVTFRCDKGQEGVFRNLFAMREKFTTRRSYQALLRPALSQPLVATDRITFLRRNEEGIYVPDRVTKDEHGTLAIQPGSTELPETLNGIPLAVWENPPASDKDWDDLTTLIEEPELPINITAVAVRIIEKDGRIWQTVPTLSDDTLASTPKNHIEERMSAQATAHKLAYEQTGLRIRLTGVIEDKEQLDPATGEVKIVRQYEARRIGGTPADMGWQSQAVHLVPKKKLQEPVAS